MKKHGGGIPETSPEIVDAIRSDWSHSGLSNEAIGEKYHVSKATVARWTSQCGMVRNVPARPKHYKRAIPDLGIYAKRDKKEEIDKGKIRALWRAGWSIPDISDDMNLDETAIENVLRGEGNEQKTDKQSADN